MTDNVVDLSGAPIDPITEGYDRQLVEMLEALIAEVKQGKFDGVAFVATAKDPPTDVEYNYMGRRLSLLAGLSRLTHRINTHLDGSSETINPLGA